MQWVVPTFHPAHILRKNRRLEGLLKHDLKRAVGLANGSWRPRWNESSTGYIMRPTADQVVETLAAMHGTEVAYDIETDGQHPMLGQIRCIGFWNGRVGICVPWLFRDGTTHEVTVVDKKGKKKLKTIPVWKKYFSGDALKRVNKAIQALFTRATKLDTQNGQYDRVCLKSRMGFNIPSAELPNFDTIIGHHVVASYLNHGLDLLTSIYTDMPYYKKTEEGEAWSTSNDRELWLYCLRDCESTWLCAQKLRQEITERPEDTVIYAHDAWQEMECQRWKEAGIECDEEAVLLFRQHYRSISTKALATMKEVVQRSVAKTKDPNTALNSANAHLVNLLIRLEGDADEEETDDLGKTVEKFNPASLIQLRSLLLGIGIPLSAETVTGQLSTAEEFLLTARKELLAQGVDAKDDRLLFLDCLFAWRASKKVESTYLYPELIAANYIGVNGTLAKRLHSTFSVHVVPSGRLASKRPNFQNCYDGETEVLTNGGWRPLRDVVREGKQGQPHRVVQWVGGKASWTTPTAYLRQISSEWIRLQSEHIDLNVTADHRCLIQTRRGEQKIVSARDFPEDKIHWNSANGWALEPEGLDLSDDELRLLVATQADGAWSKLGIDFSFSKPRKISRLRSILKRLGASFSERPRQMVGSVRFYVRTTALTKKLHRYLGPKKLFDTYLLGLNAHQRDVFIEEVMLWDGCATRMNHYASQHTQNASWVQTVFALSGHRVNTRIYRPSKGAWGSLPSHQVDVSRNGYSWTTNIKRRRSRRAADSYCLTVPSGLLLVRRNGKISVSGNCPATIRGMYVARPGHVLVYIDWDALEMRLGAFMSGDKSFIQDFAAWDARTGPKVHIVNMCNIFNIPYAKGVDEKHPGCYRAAKVFAYACFEKSTEVALLNGSRPIAKCRVGDWTWCWDGNQMVPTRIKAVIPRGFKDCLKLMVRNGVGKRKSIIVTPTHPMMRRDGTFIRVKDLQPGDRLMPFRRYTMKNGYNEFDPFNDGSRWYEHRWVAKCTGKLSEHVHHSNEKRTDNRPENLDPTNNTDHKKLHRPRRWTRTQRKAFAKQSCEMWTEDHEGVNAALIKGRERSPWWKSVRAKAKARVILARAGRAQWKKEGSPRGVGKCFGCQEPTKKLAKGLCSNCTGVLWRAERPNHVVVKIEPAGRQEVWDLSVEHPAQNFPLSKFGTMVHNTAYGGGEQTVFEQVRAEMPDMRFDQFQKIFGAYKKFRQRLFEFMRELVKRGTQHQFLDSAIQGRRTYFFEQVFGEDSPEAAAMQNLPFQSGGADVVGRANKRIVKKIVVPMQKELKPGEVLQQLAQVHDELLFEVPERLKDAFGKRLKAVAEESPGKGYDSWSLPVDLKSSRRWKPIKWSCQHCEKSLKNKVELELASSTPVLSVWTGKCEVCKKETKVEVLKNVLTPIESETPREEARAEEEVEVEVVKPRAKRKARSRSTGRIDNRPRRAPIGGQSRS